MLAENHSMEPILQVMASALGARDPYTAGHQQRVAQLACIIGAELGLSPERLQALRIAGTLHDLGKIAIPAEILAKPGKLTDLEFAMIKSHPQVGVDILKPLHFPEPVFEIMLQHHERMDGSGYPRGLKGPDILLEAKILAVADVTEAMCSHRPYRPALGLDQALEELSRHRGRLYDPQVVDACLRLSQDLSLAAPASVVPTASSSLQLAPERPVSGQDPAFREAEGRPAAVRRQPSRWLGTNLPRHLVKVGAATASVFVILIFWGHRGL